jgi:peptide deformylase
MAIRNIRKYGDEILRKKSKKVDKINGRILTLLEDMAETMYSADGIGLAAPQVGVLKRVIVVDVGEGLVNLINPEIIESQGNAIDTEGCLSIPGEQGYVERPVKLKVKGMNERGEGVSIEAEDLFARALCHEIDHLDGILFTDKLVEMENEKE